MAVDVLYSSVVSSSVSDSHHRHPDRSTHSKSGPTVADPSQVLRIGVYLCLENGGFSGELGKSLRYAQAEDSTIPAPRLSSHV